MSSAWRKVPQEAWQIGSGAPAKGQAGSEGAAEDPPRSEDAEAQEGAPESEGAEEPDGAHRSLANVKHPFMTIYRVPNTLI